MFELSAIETIVMQVTNSCPFDCPQCYTQKGNLHLSLERAEQLLDLTFRNRSGLLQITGGEPLIYPQLIELVEFCARRSIKTAIATSGYKCTTEYLSRLAAAGLDCICISLNGSTKLIHEKTRCEYEVAVSAIDCAKRVKLPCIVNWVACESNADDFVNVIKLCRDNSINTLFVLKKQPDFLGTNEDYPSIDQINNIYNLIEANDGNAISIIVEPCFKELRYEPCCLAGSDSFYVDCLGMISPCSMLKAQYSSPSEMLLNKAAWGTWANDQLRCNLLYQGLKE